MPGKRSGFRCVESAVPGPFSSSILDGDNSVEQQNMLVLSGIIMAGLCMCGLQQKKKTSRPDSQKDSSIIVHLSPREIRRQEFGRKQAGLSSYF